MEVQIHEQVIKNVPRKTIRKLFPNVFQNDAKMDPTWSRNSAKFAVNILMIFLIDFGPPRVPGRVIQSRVGGKGGTLY